MEGDQCVFESDTQRCIELVKAGEHGAKAASHQRPIVSNEIIGVRFL